MTDNGSINISLKFSSQVFIVLGMYNFGKILGWYRGPRPVIYATNPDFLKEVFIKESETYIDRPMLDRSDNVPHLIMLKGNLFLLTQFFWYKSIVAELFNFSLFH